jgi:hypothetical protein
MPGGHPRRITDCEKTKRLQYFVYAMFRIRLLRRANEHYWHSAHCRTTPGTSSARWYASRIYF